MSNPYQHQHQTTFVDTTEFGMIDLNSLRKQKVKFYGLSNGNQTIIKNRFCFKYDVQYYDFERLMSELVHFTHEQFLDFREAIDYYINQEKYPLE